MTDNEFAWVDDGTSAINIGDSFGYLDDDYRIEVDAVLDNPLIHARKVARRQTVIAEKEQNLALVVTALPSPDTELYIIGSADGREHSRTGHITANSFDYGSFIGHCVNLLLRETGATGGVKLYVSTWVMNRDTVLMFNDLLNAGRLESLHVLADKFLKRRHTSAIYAQLVEVIQSHPGSRIRLSPNHCKILCMTVRGRTVSITGSANLSAVARTEQYNLTTSPDVYQFYTEQFFEPILNAKSKGS